MFVRAKKNASGSTSVQIISKDRGKYRVFKTIGSSSDPNEIARFVAQAEYLLHHPENQPPLIATITSEDASIQNFLEHLENAQIRTIGPELIFGTLFDRIGFSAIRTKLFRHLVVARLAYPVSKLKTVDYLYRYRGIRTSEDDIYRFLDALHSKHKESVERIVYDHTKKTLGTITVVFYDMTTLYFEAEDEDDLRKIGFSKDGKFQHPQVMLGLLVGEGGYPIGYDIFEGNTFEGKTLIPTLEKIQKKYGFTKPIVIADAALLSKKNIEELRSQKYTFIIGARIKNETDEVKRKILAGAKDKADGSTFVVKKENGRLIVSYAEKRARKDARNREKGLKKLRLQIQYGKLTKANISKRGYNKFLKLEGETSCSIDEERVASDGAWDGLKGYVTNTTLAPKTVINHYGHLWQIEKAFRISKTDLRIRPVHHYRRRRIEAHLCIAFVAYAIWKEVERLLQKAGVCMSPKRAGELTHNMYEIMYALPHSKQLKRTVLKMDGEQKLLYKVVHR